MNALPTADQAGERAARQLRAQVHALRAAAERAVDPVLRRRLHDKAQRLEQRGERLSGTGRVPSV
ncbi:DUF6381 family protein [Streptomyces sp. NPDC048111]|uniref:DUF6381 family protein n=1 Tax=Streptomyces sp. NPDC048111 TaxID=3365500 RepID=UPI00370F9264